MKMRGAGGAFCLLLLAAGVAAQLDTRHLSGQCRESCVPLLSFGEMERCSCLLSAVAGVE